MATFYIQLENKLLQISGELTAENISKALGYVPVDSSTMNNYATKDEVSDLVDMSMVEELSQRVDNITFDSLKDNPFLQDGSGELNIVDESGNIIAKIDAEGIHSVDFIAGEHRLSNKTDKTYVDEAVKNVKVDLTGYATEEWVENKNYLTEHQDISHLATKDEVSNIDFYNIKDNPIVNNGDGKLLFVDENGYIGLQLEENGLYVKDVIADGHTLSQKADKSELSNYATKDEVSDLVDMSVVTELQGKVNTLIDADADKSVRDIAVDVLTETLVSETATEAYDTLAEMSAWIKSHPEDAASMNEAIQKNATDIQSNTTAISNLDAAYKAADAKVLTDAQEYTDNINFFTIKDNPIVDGEAGSITFVDETGYIGLKVTEDGIIAKDVVTPEHTLSNKADKSELPTKTSDLTNDSGFITLTDIPEVEIPSLDEYVKSEDLPNFDEFAKTEDIPSLDGYAKLEDIPEIPEIPSLDGYATEEWVNNKNYATEDDLNNIDYSSINNVPVSEDETGELNITDESGNIGMKVASEAVYAKDFVAGEHKLSEKVDKTYVDNLELDELNAVLVDTDSVADDPIVPDYVTESELETALSSKMDKVTLAKIATSGNYNDLTNKPTIPAAVSESTVSGWGFTKNTGTYSKPSGGIPKTDLASAVQTSLGKADTALQSYTEQYKGTITGVSANGKSVATSGVANIPAASTSAYGVTKLNSSTSSNSTTEAATPSAVKAAYDLANNYKGTVTGVKINGTTKSQSNGVVDLGTVITDISGKQDKLVSGTNIKTINGTSILGSGDIVISGGGSSSGGNGSYSEVNHGTSDTTFTLTPNTFHVWDEVASLTLDLGSETSGVANEFLFQFTSGATAMSLTLPDDIKWTGGEAPSIEANKIYQISILKGLGSVMEWNNAKDLINNLCTYDGFKTVTFQYPVASDVNVYIGVTMNNAKIVSLSVGETTGTLSFLSDPGSGILAISPTRDNTYNYIF